MPFPTLRLRRLRENPRVRALVREHRVLGTELIQPLFVKEGLSRPSEIASMPGQFQWTETAVAEEARRVADAGVPAVMLFGVPAKKDTAGNAAFSSKGAVQSAVRRIKKARPNLLVVTDVCLCEYLSHGHCGHVRGGKVLNDPTLVTLARIARSHADAGADMVAPSDMMDGRVAAIRRGLDSAGYQSLPILAYAVKYASAFYGPFRDAAGSAPKFGDRASYQMNPANVREALREAQTDLAEGADLILVKPALAYGDVIRAVKEKLHCTVGAYSVSGEYAMIKAAAQKGWIDEKKIVLETHLSLKRAGADFIVTYWAADLARWVRKGNGAR